MFFSLNIESAWRGCVSVWKSASCAGDQVGRTAFGQTAMMVMMIMMEKMMMVMIVMHDDDDRVVPERAISIRLLEVSSWFACPLERYHSKVARTCFGRSNCSTFSGGRGRGALRVHVVQTLI